MNFFEGRIPHIHLNTINFSTPFVGLKNFFGRCITLFASFFTSKAQSQAAQKTSKAADHTLTICPHKPRIFPTHSFLINHRIVVRFPLPLLTQPSPLMTMPSTALHRMHITLLPQHVFLHPPLQDNLWNPSQHTSLPLSIPSLPKTPMPRRPLILPAPTASVSTAKPSHQPLASQPQHTARITRLDSRFHKIFDTHFQSEASVTRFVQQHQLRIMNHKKTPRVEGFRYTLENASQDVECGIQKTPHHLQATFVHPTDHDQKLTFTLYRN